jgi:hypothetical protein
MRVYLYVHWWSSTFQEHSEEAYRILENMVKHFGIKDTNRDYIVCKEPNNCVVELVFNHASGCQCQLCLKDKV